MPTWPTACACEAWPRDQGRSIELLDALGLAPLAEAPARTLSGGEIQRVSFARALAFDPEVLLLDEPTANLDPRNVRLVEDMIRERKSQGVTMVLATHQIFQARRLAHRTALLLDGQIVESAPTAQLLDHPADPRTRAFLSGDMVLLTLTAVGCQLAAASLQRIRRQRALRGSQEPSQA